MLRQYSMTMTFLEIAVDNLKLCTIVTTWSFNICFDKASIVHAHQTIDPVFPVSALNSNKKWLTKFIYVIDYVTQLLW